MALSLLQNYTAIRDIGLSVPFGASGGMAPYIYSMAPGGAGGTINSSTGIYVSPIGTTGVDTIIVTDSAGSPATAQGSISVGLPIQLVANIIETQLQIPGQVWLYQQKENLPSDSKVYIAVGLRTHKAFANKPSYTGGSTNLIATQSVNIYQTLSIDLLSRSLLPLSEVDRVIMALSSPYAESLMELSSFFCAPIPTSIVNISGIDGPAIPYHLQLTVTLQYFSILASSVPDYTLFEPPAITPET